MSLRTRVLISALAASLAACATESVDTRTNLPGSELEESERSFGEPTDVSTEVEPGLVQAAAAANSRKARELNLIAGVREAVAEPADSLDEIDGELLAQAPDEHLDGI